MLLRCAAGWCRLARSIEAKNPDRTSVRVANALEEVAALELLQAGGRMGGATAPGHQCRRWCV